MTCDLSVESVEWDVGSSSRCPSGKQLDCHRGLQRFLEKDEGRAPEDGGDTQGVVDSTRDRCSRESVGFGGTDRG